MTKSITGLDIITQKNIINLRLGVDSPEDDLMNGIALLIVGAVVIAAGWIIGGIPLSIILNY